jgi:DNA topoisomerase I
MSNVLIVESPNKVKKIQGFVGNSYIVTSSKGHIRNMDPKKLSIDVDNNFNPTYIITPDKLNVVRSLKSDCKGADTIWLATDYDREGEAIAWHLSEVLKLKPENRKRIIFTEITKKAILNSISNPGDIDMNMFYSQQARMVLDKLIGYKVSPTLWQQYKNYQLSAGRVQSVVVKLIIEREENISKFNSESYFKTLGNFCLDKKKDKIDIETDCDIKITGLENIKSIMNLEKNGNIEWTVDSVKKNNTKRRPAPPFITSTLQQEASYKLGMSPDNCMKVAQKLYEGGHITYMRTDSLIMSDEALNSIRDIITKDYGEKYYARKQYSSKSKNAQEAHEACRPTHFDKESLFGINGVTSQMNSLYRLIWKRTVASQMSPAEVEIKTVKIRMTIDKDANLNSDPTKLNDKYKSLLFSGKHEKILFDGHLKVTNNKSVSKKNATKDDEEEEDETEGGNADNGESESSNDSGKVKIKEDKNLEILFDSLKKGQQVFCFSINSEEKMTKPPNARFTEASLVKKLDELGIGRPSTYASMVNKVQQRQYIELKTKPHVNKDITTLEYSSSKKGDQIVEKSKTIKVDGDKNKLFPTSLGNMVNSFLIKEFIDLLDYGFTAKVETLLDEIAQGKKIWYKVVASVYDKITPVIDRLNIALKESGGQKVDMSLGIHPVSGNEVKIVTTRFGMAICEKFPNVKESKYATLTCLPEEMTLEKALKLLSFPKKLGQYQGKDVLLAKAKTAFFKYNGKNYSIDIYNKTHPDDTINSSDDNLVNITLDEAIKVIDDRAKTDELSQQEVKFSKDIVIKNGRYGFYIKYKNKDNIPIPKKDKETMGTKLDKKTITKERVDEIVQKFLNKKAGIKDAKPTNLTTSDKKSTTSKKTDNKDESSTTKSTTKSSRGRGGRGRGRGGRGRGKGVK